MPESQRTLAEVESSAAGLEEAIESLEAIAQHPQTPYPKALVEGRANMARNTMRKQLERSIQSQKEYELKNAEKLQHSLELRQAELRKREEAKEAAVAAEKERKRLIAEERQKIAEQDRILAEQRAEEDRAREAAEMTTDSETGEQVKRKRKPARSAGKRKKKDGVDSSGDESGADGQRRSRRKEGGATADESEDKPKKKRKLTKKSSKKAGGKYKSSEIVVESDSEGGSGGSDAKHLDGEISGDGYGPNDKGAMEVDAAEASDEEEITVVPVVRKNRTRRIESDDEDEDKDEDFPTTTRDKQSDPDEEGSHGTAKGNTVDTPMTDVADASDEE